MRRVCGRIAVRHRRVVGEHFWGRREEREDALLRAQRRVELGTRAPCDGRVELVVDLLAVPGPLLGIGIPLRQLGQTDGATGTGPIAVFVEHAQREPPSVRGLVLPDER